MLLLIYFLSWAYIDQESDDPDNLGHFFMGQVETKLSECDLDITCSLENSVGIW